MNKFVSSSTNNRWWDLLAAVLLLLILTTAFMRLAATDWTEHLMVTRSIAYLGLGAGLALGFSRFSPSRVTFFALIYGLFVVIWRVGLTLGEGIPWQERLLSLSGRIGVILTNLIQQKAVPDNLLFLVLMGVVFWVISIHAGYSLTRHANPWSAIIPTGVTLVLIHSYDSYLSGRVWYLVLFLFFSLLFVTRVVYINYRQKWETNQTYVPPYIGLDFIRLALIASVILLLFSWTVPALAESIPAAEDTWLRLKQPWNDIRNTFDNAFASLRSTIGIVSDYYGPNLSLGRGNLLSDTVLFTISTPSDPPDGTRFYWRARVYDWYDAGWSSTSRTTHAVDQEGFDLTIPTPTTGSSRLVEYPFTFRLGSSIATLFTVNQATWLSRPSQAEYFNNPDGTADISSIRATPPLRAGETYSTRSYLNEVTISDLRQAGTNYPEWVRERYLQLPPSITPRTIQLAREIAAGEDNPYDIVNAVTNYLRSNIEYSDTVPALPNNQELVDWFLFDLQQGFCNYYATAEIVMLRAVGIPARLSVGFAQGTVAQDVPDMFIVRQSDAHAWPEVYFPGFGWVEFEPTVSQPLLARPLGELPRNLEPGSGANLPDDDPLAGLENESLGGDEEGAGAIGDLDTQGIPIYYFIILGVLFLLLLALLIPLAWRKRLHERLPSIPLTLERGFMRFGLHPPSFLRRWARRAALSPLARAYLEINLALSRLGNHPQPNDTPSERAAELISMLPILEHPAHILITEYHTVTYSPQQKVDLQAARRAGSKIRLQSFKAFFQNIFRRRKDHQGELQ
jgi:transglutaminase-like putative cysteine protease